MSKIPKIRLGYACLHTGLRKKDIFCSRTARSETIRNYGIEYAIELFSKNLDDLLIILETNEKSGIRFYRISSEIAPHLSNPEFIPKASRSNPKILAYEFSSLIRRKLKLVGDYAKAHGHRLTFHPAQFVVLGSPNPATVLNSSRELYMHAKILDYMGLDSDSIIIVHGGGAYGDKPAAIDRWVQTFAALPLNVKHRLVVENDEYSYSTTDVLEISRRLYEFPGCGQTYKIPIVFDIFHYQCMNSHTKQPPIKSFMPQVVDSWKGRTIKMHISEQGRGPLGKHAGMVHSIPKWMLSFPQNLDIMVEAKNKEVATRYLMKKYGL